VARAGLAERPPIEPPRLLRPLLQFTRLPRRGAEVVRSVLEDDLVFRSRVALAAAGMEDELGRASWLFVARPAGWEDELAALTAEQGEAAAAAEDEAAEQRAVRQLRGARERIARLEAEVAAAKDREAEATAELAAARRLRHAAAERAQQLEDRVAAQEAQLAELRGALDALRAEVDAAAAAAASAGPPPGNPPPPAAPALDIADLRAILGEAARSAGSVAQALDDAVSLLAEAAQTGQGTSSPAGRGRPARGEGPQPSPAKSRRQPLRLPPGVLDDSQEAADYLVRANGAVVIVDGYNATLSAWPDLPLGEQRRRLVDALAELTARSGADIQVVFDGSQESPGPTAVPRASGAARHPVRVLFSPVDVPADDVIVELVDAAAPHRPVVVASDDREVQARAAARGANVLNRTQLLAVLRRGPSSALG